MIHKKKHTKNKIKTLHPLITVSIILFTASFAGRLYVSSVMASKSIELKELYAKKISLQREISKLEYEDLQLSSLSQIESDAHKLGFVPFNGLLSAIDLDTPQPLALR